MNINVPLQFINEPSKYPDSIYPYRVKIIPEAVENKQIFMSSLNKYESLPTGTEYVFEEKIYDSNGFYLYSTEKTAANYRNFSIGIDKVTVGTEEQGSTSNEFLNPDGFLLFTYDNEDSRLVDNLNEILITPTNTFEIYTKDAENYIKVSINRQTLDPFITNYFLLLTPEAEPFQFGKNTITYNSNGQPKSINNLSGVEIIDSHFITVDNTNNTYKFDQNTDSNGKPFASDLYNTYLIAQDQLMNIWSQYSINETGRYALDYSCKFLDKDGSVTKIYPQISSTKKIIAKPTIIDSSSSLESILKSAGTRYLHFTLNKTVLIENIFDTSVSENSIFPNYTTTRRNVIYKPTLDVNLTGVKDDTVVSTENEGVYYKLSLQNRNLLSNISETPLIIPSSKRAYALNGNKIFCRALKQNEGPFSSSVPQKIEAIYPEGVINNCFQISESLTGSFFGKDNGEIFDISIIKLNDLSGVLSDNIKDQNSKLQDIYRIPINSTTANTQTNCETVFNNFILDGNCNSAFNLVNVTPPDNGAEFSVDPKNLITTFESTPDQQKVYTIEGNLINNKFGLTSLNNLYYAGIPVIDSVDQLNFNIALLEAPASTFYKNIKIYCYNGENLINDVNFQIDQANNIIKISIKNLKPQNYYTYSNSYATQTSIRNDSPFSKLSFWKFSDAKNLAFAHLSAKNALGTIPKYNFHTQALELSIVVTF